MTIATVDPSRVFRVGESESVSVRDCGRIELDPDEQVTFVSGAGTEYDVVRKSWGYYATPSVNGRLVRFRLRTALVRNSGSLYFILLVERGKEPLFEEYVSVHQLSIVAWLDDEEHLRRIEEAAEFELRLDRDTRSV